MLAEGASGVRGWDEGESRKREVRMGISVGFTEHGSQERAEKGGCSVAEPEIRLDDLIWRSRRKIEDAQLIYLLPR